VVIRSRFRGNPPLARHSVWCLPILTGHEFLNHFTSVAVSRIVMNFIEVCA
jgi:hypothetical protein